MSSKHKTFKSLNAYENKNITQKILVSPLMFCIFKGSVCYIASLPLFKLFMLLCLIN